MIKLNINRLIVLATAESREADQALCEIAKFLGLHVDLVSLGDDFAEPSAELLPSASGGPVIALSCITLRQVFQREWFERLLNTSRFVFVYNFLPTDGESPELKWLTGGALSSVAAISAGLKRFKVASDVKFGDFPVCGKSYSAESGSSGAFCGVGSGAGVEEYISVDGHPLFVSLARGSSHLFLLAEPALVSIDKVLSPEMSLRPWYSQLIAATIFLRSAFRDWCWTAPVTGATFIVDDPSLKPRYGFVQYEILIRELQRTGGALTIAFIPYNHRRSDLRTIELLLRHSNSFSICIHGCDHTGGEFASLDERWLLGTTACALERMQSHTQRTQMPFDNVMVFPQGRFSTKAVRALKAMGVAAAVNTTPWPEDYQEKPLTIRDLLDVAVTQYDSFPIFVRRYPEDVFDYAFDALFQKPIFAVEHHGFFRHGYSALATLMQDLSTLKRQVLWMPLGSSVTSSCVVKRMGEAHFALRHFTPAIKFENPFDSDLRLSIEKPEQDGQVEAVVVGDQKVPFQIDSGLLKYEAILAAGTELNTKILYREPLRVRRKTSWKYRFTTSARRLVSDLRDNQLARSELVLSFAEKIKRVVAHRR